MMTDGIYRCDVDDYWWLLTREGNKQDWFFWWLQDNGIDPEMVYSVTYNELQGTIYTEEYDWDADWLEVTRDGKRIGIRPKHKHRLTTLKSYPVVADPPGVLLDRWDWLMEEIRGSEREIGASV